MYYLFATLCYLNSLWAESSNQIIYSKSNYLNSAVAFQLLGEPEVDELDCVLVFGLHQGYVNLDGIVLENAIKRNKGRINNLDLKV